MTNLLTQREVCRELRICPKTLQTLRKSGKIEYMRIGHRTIRFSQDAVEKFLKENRRCDAKLA